MSFSGILATALAAIVIFPKSATEATIGHIKAMLVELARLHRLSFDTSIFGKEREVDSELEGAQTLENISQQQQELVGGQSVGISNHDIHIGYRLLRPVAMTAHAFSSLEHAEAAGQQGPR